MPENDLVKSYSAVQITVFFLMSALPLISALFFTIVNYKKI